MTLYAPDGLMMVMMERFETLTSSVDCKGDDGSMFLTFKSQDAFSHALQQWSYINQNDDGKFLLIANHDGCGPDDQRQPYLISQILEDLPKLTTHLIARTTPWSDIAGTYDLDFGRVIPYANPRLKERGIWGDIVNIGKDVLNAAESNTDLSKSVNFNVNVGYQGQKTNIYTDDKGRLTLDCINCFVTGAFQVTGHISVDHFDLQDLTLTASPQGFQAELEVEATITSSESPDSLQYTKELFSFPIPDAGIEVEGIFKLGATLSYDVGVSSSFSGSATVDFGLQAAIPDSAQLVADIQNPDQSSANGFGTGDLSPIFDIKKESASVTVAAFSQPKLAFGIELIEVGNIDVAITIKLPEISSTLSAEYDESGVCDQSAGASKTGVKVENKVDVEIDLQIDAHLGSGEETAKPSWSKKLWGIEKPLGGLCFPMDIPGLEGKGNSTSGTALPSTGPSSPSSPSLVSSAVATRGASPTPSPTESPSPSSAGRLSKSSATSTGSPDMAASLSVSSSVSKATSAFTSRAVATATSSKSSTARERSTSSTEKSTMTRSILPASTTSKSRISVQSQSRSTSSASSGDGGGGCRMVKRFGKRMLVC
ncbi:hypothetical protein ACLMJK_004301 [Lecanora helva]